MSLIPEINSILGNIEINDASIRSSIIGSCLNIYVKQKDDINYSYVYLAYACHKELVCKDVAINYLINADTSQSLYWLNIIYAIYGEFVLSLKYENMHRKKTESYKDIILQKSGTLSNVDDIPCNLPNRESYKYELHLIKLYKQSCDLNESKFAYDLCIKHKDDYANVLQHNFKSTYRPHLMHFYKDIADIILTYLF